MEPRGFEGASAGAANSTSRALGYAAALGLAERAADELPIVPEDDRLAWSNATGEWHVVRVRYPFRPGYGRHPALMLVVGLVVGAGLLWLQQFLLDVARGDALQGITEDFPDQADLIAGRRPGAGGRSSSCRCCGWSGSSSPAPSTCWRRSSGRASSCALAGHNASCPFPRLLRPFARRDRFSLFIAVDDGRSDRVSAWLSNERTAVPQGARARVKATPVLGYVRRSEPIGTTRS